MHIRGVLAITADDDTDLTERIIGFYIETAGNVAVTMHDGSTAVLPSLTAGVLHLCPAKRILATGTEVVGVITGVY